MLNFANIEYLYLLLLIPVFIVGHILFQISQRKKLKRFGEIEMIESLMPNKSIIRPHIKFTLMMLIFGLLVVAAARPQVSGKKSTTTRQGVEAMIVLDISNSMLATDIQPNRLEYSKMLLSQLIDKMPNDKIGLIVFAGDAFIQMPITSDNVSAKMFLKSIQPSLIQRQGTAIGSAIELAVKSFGETKQNVGRAIFLITDAENHEDNAIEAAEMAEKKGIQVNVVGIGSPDGAPIPMQGTMSYLKDREGNVVVTKLNEELAKQVSSAGGGSYIRANQSGAVLRNLEKVIDGMQKGDFKVDSSDYDDRFYIPVWIALFLLLIEFFMLRRKNKRLSRINLFNRQKGDAK